MEIKIKFEPGTRVTWYSDQYNRQLSGYVHGITIELNKDNTETTYAVWCDIEFKSSFIHRLPESALEKEVVNGQ
jgi:hypothetical protein